MARSEPTAAEIRTWAEGLSDGALSCRSQPGGHAPIFTTVDEATLRSPRRKVFIQYYRCRNNCGCTWSQVVDAISGEQYSLRIHYPPADEYLAPGIGRIYGSKKNIVRLVAIERRKAKGK